MSQQNATLQPVTLPYVQSQLLSIDEKRGLTSPASNFNDYRRYKPGGSYAMTARMIYKTPQKQKGKQPSLKIKCGYKPCGKLGHTTADCRKCKRDEEYKSRQNKNLRNKGRPKTINKANIRCYKCNGMGHYSMQMNVLTTRTMGISKL
jgi:Zinc knuckle